ncbi:hypothetical protein DV738_g1796, partial [Chaetothyriales sp. CBS 135597]
MPSALPFEPQPLEAPLSDQAKRKLQELAAKRVNDYSLYPRITKAIDFLDKAVGPLIDRAVEEKERHGKKQARLAERGEEQDAAEQERYEAFQTKVEELTKAMDESIRQAVDTRVWLEELPNALKQVTNTASTQTQRTTQQSIPPSQDLSARQANTDLDEDEDEGRHVPRDSTQVLSPEQTPSVLLRAALDAQESAWRTKTLTDKYAHDNDYVGWYTNRWNALNPGDSAPPMPSAAIWFAAEEGRRHNGPSAMAGGDRNDNSEEEDSDIEIAREKINIKCPITLRPLEDPVTSSKCNHSFEKTTILNLIERSTDRGQLSAEQEAEIATIRPPRDRVKRREELRQLLPRGIKCPECRTFFTQADLKPNLVLKRRVQRQLEWQRKQDERARLREEEDDDDEGMESDGTDSDDLRGTQQPVGITSSPLQQTKGRPVKLKEDPSNSGRIPETQPPPGRATTDVMDLDEDT